MLSLVLLATAANGRINIQLDSSGGLITGGGNGIITDTFGPGLSDRGGARPFPSLTTPAVAEEAPPPFIDIVLTPTVVPDPLPMRKLTSKLIVECKVTSNLQAISAWKSARGLS